MAAELEGGAFLSASLKVLIYRLTSEDFFGVKASLIKYRDELNEKLKSAVEVVKDVEEKLSKDQMVKQWLDDLQEAVYDADDLVYEISTEALRNKLVSESQSSLASKVMTKLRPTSFAAFGKSIKPGLDEILSKLKVLLEQKDILVSRTAKIQGLRKRLPTIPLVEESDVYGRDGDKEAIIKLLISDDASGDKLSGIPIVGVGGIGKTTLAQLVYKDERVTKGFDTKVWVTVGDYNVDYFEVMKKIIQEVANSDKCKIEEQVELPDKLKKVFTGKKSLLVLDDIWDLDPKLWNILKSSFESGLHGSKIILTTRNNAVASIMQTELIYRLDRISNDDGWRLFAKYASIDANSDDYSDLQVIGRKMVHKCNGLPLAIKSLAGVLRTTGNKGEWDYILNSDNWGLDGRSSIDILPSLWLSYYHLPPYLKSCFAYCALFPKGYELKKENIILLWMAEGLLHSEDGSNDEKNLEKFGEEYFQDLISRSFFQLSSEDESTFVIHDFMHDLATLVSGEFCLQMDDKMDDINFHNSARKIRHLSFIGGVDDPKKFEVLSKSKNLRTFLTFSKSRSGERWSLRKEHLLETLLHTSGCLRVLSVSRSDITHLPESIGDLKYLRYLDLSYTRIEEIPKTVCNLYNLETLLLEGCVRLTRLPTRIGNLINLRHLHTPPNLEEMPLQLGKLKNLRTLSEFVVSKGEGNKSSVKLLGELPNLHGTLHISRLEKVADVKEVSEAELGEKFLTELILEWGSSHAPDEKQKESEVLDALKPHSNLKEIDIRNYLDTSFPNWIGDRSFSNVVAVRLFDCKNSSLPPLGQLPSLKHLLIQGFHAVETVSSDFYSGTTLFRSLEVLCFMEMPNLREWSFIEGEVEGGVFPRLKELELRVCPKLKLSLCGHLQSLRKLVINNCDQLLPLIPRGAQMDAAFPSLETMSISRCDGQESLLEGGLPSSLKQISILHCWKLMALDEETFQRLTSLKKLEISFCDSLLCLPRSGLPTSLSYLSIESCRLLTPRLQRETGEDWPIIAHIQTLDIRSIHYLNDKDNKLSIYPE